MTSRKIYFFAFLFGKQFKVFLNYFASKKNKKYQLQLMNYWFDQIPNWRNAPQKKKLIIVSEPEKI